MRDAAVIAGSLKPGLHWRMMGGLLPRHSGCRASVCNATCTTRGAQVPNAAREEGRRCHPGAPEGAGAGAAAAEALSPWAEAEATEKVSSACSRSTTRSASKSRSLP